MTLLAATLTFGLILLALGLPLLLAGGGAAAAFKGFPRSTRASWLLFGAGSIWFLDVIWHLSPADFGDYRGWLFIAFAAIAVLSFKCVPDFLAVRGACVIVLLGATPLLDAAYLEFEHPQRLFMVTPIYVAIVFAIWLGAQPWRLRDFFEWLFARPSRARGFGGLLAAYGIFLAVVAFTY